jgi:hypothetical protein
MTDERKSTYRTSLVFRNTVHYAGNVHAAAPPCFLACSMLSAIAGGKGKAKNSQLGREGEGHTTSSARCCFAHLSWQLDNRIN